MKRILITGMSATGKSSVICELARRGHKAFDTSWNPEYESPDPQSDGPGWIWREDRIRDLLDAEDAAALFIAACVRNQGRFYDRFDQIVLLSASVDLTVERLATRSTNAYGKSPEEVAQVLHVKETVEPQLRTGATAEIDTSVSLDQVVRTVLDLAQLTETT